MDFLADILTGTLIGGASSATGRVVLLVFGVLLIIVGIALPFYERSLAPIAVENYYSTEISYSRVYYNGKTDNPEIIVAGDARNYRILRSMWGNHYSAENIVDGLSKGNRAKIWLNSPDDSIVTGIVSPTFSIAPSIGVAWEVENRGVWTFLSWLFIGCGSVITIIILFFSSFL